MVTQTQINAGWKHLSGQIPYLKNFLDYCWQ